MKINKLNISFILLLILALSFCFYVVNENKSLQMNSVINNNLIESNVEIIENLENENSLLEIRNSVLENEIENLENEIRELTKEEKYVSSEDGVNIYIDPTFDSEIVGTLQFNEIIEVYPLNEDWFEYIIDDTIYYVSSITLSDEKTYILLGYYTLTAYCSCSICCGEWSDGITYSGAVATQGITVANNSIAIGTKILIDGHEYTVQDKGGMSNNVIDVYFSSHDEALAFGKKYNIPVYLA